VFLVLEIPELDAEPWVESNESKGEGGNPLPHPADHTGFGAVDNSSDFLGCKRTLPIDIHFFIRHYPQVLLRRAALNPSIPQSVLMLEITLTQVQDLALGLAEFHKVCLGPVLKVPLEVIPSH